MKYIMMKYLYANTLHRNFLHFDGMRCYRSDWPGLYLFCCSQPLCVVSQQSWFGLFFLYIHFVRFTPPPPRTTPFLQAVASTVARLGVSHMMKVGGGWGVFWNLRILFHMILFIWLTSILKWRSLIKNCFFFFVYNEQLLSQLVFFIAFSCCC